MKVCMLFIVVVETLNLNYYDVFLFSPPIYIHPMDILCWSMCIMSVCISADLECDILPCCHTSFSLGSVCV